MTAAASSDRLAQIATTVAIGGGITGLLGIPVFLNPGPVLDLPPLTLNISLIVGALLGFALLVGYMWVSENRPPQAWMVWLGSFAYNAAILGGLIWIGSFNTTLAVISEHGTAVWKVPNPYFHFFVLVLHFWIPLATLLSLLALVMSRRQTG